MHLFSRDFRRVHKHSPYETLVLFFEVNNYIADCGVIHNVDNYVRNRNTTRSNDIAQSGRLNGGITFVLS